MGATGRFFVRQPLLISLLSAASWGISVDDVTFR